MATPLFPWQTKHSKGRAGEDSRRERYGLLDASGAEPEDLDECGGHSSDLPFYHYHAQRQYPYTVACLKGCLDQTSGFNRRVSGKRCTCAEENGECVTVDYSSVLPTWAYPAEAAPAPAPAPAATPAPVAAPSPVEPGACLSSAPAAPSFLVFQPDDMPFYWAEAPEVAADAPGTPFLDRVPSEGTARSADGPRGTRSFQFGGRPALVGKQLSARL